MVLAYHSHYFIRSVVAVSTNSVQPNYVDDTEAIQNFVTTEDLVMLVIYNESNVHGAVSDINGKTITIQVDGVDLNGIGVRQDSVADAVNRKNGSTVYYLCALTAGAHTVKGRFACGAAPFTSVTISERQLAIFLFRGAVADWGFTSSIVVSNTNSVVFVDDPNATVNVNLPSDNMIVLVLYSAGSEIIDLEHPSGKEIAIRVDAGADVARHGQSGDPTGPTTAEICGCSTHVIYSNLLAGAHTFRGRFLTNNAVTPAQIRNRQLAVLIFSESQLFDQILDDATALTTNSTSKVDDVPATINRNLLATYETLILYSHWNTADFQDAYGRKAGIMVDAVDYSQSYQSAQDARKCGNTVCHVIQLTAGAHTIKGRFAANRVATVSIGLRTMCVLYFPRGPSITQQHLQKVMRGGL